MRIAITGHRPEDLPNIKGVTEKLESVLFSFNPEMVYVGMAAGVDLIAGEICLRNNIPYAACKPWAGHTPRIADRNLYNRVEAGAAEVHNVDSSQSYPGVWVYHNRNKFMVDRAELVLAVWSGKTNGGTAACVKYAKQKQKSLLQLLPGTLETNMLNSQYGLF